MSVSIFWKKIKNDERLVPAMTPSHVIETIENVFERELPCVFTKKDLPKLEASRDSALFKPDPWAYLCRAVKSSGSGIKVWAEY